MGGQVEGGKGNGADLVSESSARFGLGCGALFG